MAAIVFLRGMNVGRRRITNDELVAVFLDAGHADVSAYQASGNIVIESVDSVDPSTVSEQLAAALGYAVEVFVRTTHDISSIASTSPIAGRSGSQGGKPQIVFLHNGDPQPIDAVFPADHEVHQVGSEIHWLPPTGLAELGHVHSTMDKVLGPNTVRTLGTIERLAKRLL